jgi:integrase
MSLLFKRSRSPYWYVTKTRQSTGTSNRKLAEEFAKKTLTEQWREEKLGEKVYQWSQLVEDWLDFKSGMASLEQDEMVIKRFSALLTEREISALPQITKDVLMSYAKQVKRDASASTANRHMTTLRAMLYRAKDNEWLTTVPAIESYHVTKTEVQFVSVDQMATILPHLPEWIKDMATFAMQTGLRFSNVAELEWSWVSPDSRIVIVPAVHAKTKRTYTIPLSTVARELIEAIRSRKSHERYVFVGKKRISHGVYEDCAPVQSIRYWWECAREAAGFPDLTWHQATRHSFASAHTQNGTPDRVLMKMGGWSSPRMLETYAHLKTEHLTPYVENINRGQNQDG